MANRSGDEPLDVAIAGGGHAGLALAVALRQAAPDMAVAVVDPRPPEQAPADERASAVAAAAQRMLDRLGVWAEVKGVAQPITAMEVTDSRTDDTVRPVFLTFGDEAMADEPFAHMVPNGPLGAGLRTAARQAGVDFIVPDSVAGFADRGATVEIALSRGEKRHGALLVAADGLRSRLRSLAGIRTVSWRYDQSAIVATVAHERPHNGVAIEHFLPSGPFAILPLTGNRSSLVWTEAPDVAERLVAADPFVFNTELERRFGYKLGAVELAGPRQCYPLSLTLVRDFVKPRLALLGEAAHGIHPIAGQGLNLGFRDAAALAETIVEARRLGLDIGSLSVLERYQTWRRFDTFQMGVTTDVLNRLFSNDLSPVRAARDFGLSLVDRMPRLKKMFINEAAGFGGDPPRLLRGEAI